MKRVKAMGLGAMLLLLVLAVMLLLTRQSVSGFENSCIQKKVGDNSVCWCDIPDDKWPVSVQGLDYAEYRNYIKRFTEACKNNTMLPCMPDKLSAMYKKPNGIDITSLFNMFDISNDPTVSNDDRTNIMYQLIGIQSGANCAQ